MSTVNVIRSKELKKPFTPNQCIINYILGVSKLWGINLLCGSLLKPKSKTHFYLASLIKQVRPFEDCDCRLNLLF